MADKQGKNTGTRRQSSRLQRRAPASIQINRSTDWNVAIPLLSPLVTSPTSPRFNLKAEMSSVPSQETEKKEKQPMPPPATTAATFKKWQHPAAPFYYEPAPLVPFVCTAAFGSVDRR